MGIFTQKNIGIRGLATVVPQQKEDNHDLPGLTDLEKQQFSTVMGIRYRHIAPEKTTVSDLCVKAAQKVMHSLDWKPEEIDLLVVVTQTPEHHIPGPASQIHERLGLPTNILALDLNQGCAGYVYGLATISGMMAGSSTLQKGLLLVGDTLSRIISKNDYSLRPLFGDAGSATALEKGPEFAPMHFSLGTIGSEFEAIHIPEGGAKTPTSTSSLEENLTQKHTKTALQLHMKGHDVFTFGLTAVAPEINRLLAHCETKPTEIDYLVLHQANKLLIDTIGKKVSVTKDQLPNSLYEYGNSSCASIPLTICAALNATIGAGEKRLLLSGFGAGLSWGNVLLTLEAIQCTPPEEI